MVLMTRDNAKFAQPTDLTKFMAHKPQCVTCVIIDNDARNNHQLELEIRKHPDHLELTHTFTDYREAINRLSNLRPDVVFVNITFPFFSGLDMLGNSTILSTKVIFLANESNYIHQSMKASRFDCLLKPLVIPELRRTLKRLKSNPRQKFVQYSNPIPGVSAKQFEFNKIALPTARGFIFIEPKEILYCQADQEYTRLVTLDKTHVISKNLKYFETRLDNTRFFRVHKSFLLNLEHIESYVKTEGGHVVMSDNKVIHVGRSRKTEFSIVMGI